MTYSQIGQDSYVLEKITTPGFYIEVGAYDPREISNTYLLEQKGWKGFSFDILDIDSWQEYRTNPLFKCDAASFDFSKFLIEKHCPDAIDYVSWDIDYTDTSQLHAVYNFPWLKYQVKIITIEHDAYRVNPAIRAAMRTFFTNQGYHLDKPDMKDVAQEDWWILK